MGSQNLKQECLNTLSIMKKKTIGYHGNNYEGLYILCEKGELSDLDMQKIIEKHRVI